MGKRFTLVVDIHLFLIKKGAILLLKRSNTGYMDGYYHVPAGHLNGNERLIDALIRESKEEIGIDINEKDVKLAHVMHNKSNNERIALFFEVKNWEGEIKNMEPEKHSKIKWFVLSKLPKKIVPYARQAIKHCQKGVILSRFGW